MQQSFEQAPPARQTRGSETTETEVIVIGSGIGGLSCGALLAKYGVKVWTMASSPQCTEAQPSLQMIVDADVTPSIFAVRSDSWLMHHDQQLTRRHIR